MAELQDCRPMIAYLNRQEALLHEGHYVVHMSCQVMSSSLEQKVGLVYAALRFAPHLLHILLVLFLNMLDLRCVCVAFLVHLALEYGVIAAMLTCQLGGMAGPC